MEKGTKEVLYAPSFKWLQFDGSICVIEFIQRTFYNRFPAISFIICMHFKCIDML